MTAVPHLRSSLGMWVCSPCRPPKARSPALRWGQTLRGPCLLKGRRQDRPPFQADLELLPVSRSMRLPGWLPAAVRSRPGPPPWGPYSGWHQGTAVTPSAWSPSPGLPQRIPD